MKWTEGEVHRAMRHHLKASGWSLIAGEYPGGSDHELYPLNIVDPAVARDRSPDPRRHSKGELIPDLVALRSGMLIFVSLRSFFGCVRKILRPEEAERRSAHNDACCASGSGISCDVRRAACVATTFIFARGRPKVGALRRLH